MRILVGVKRAIDYAVKVRVLPDKSGVDLTNVKMSMNPFCEIAMEEAVRLKDKKIATEIVAVSIGPKACKDTLLSALAMGADKAIHIDSNLRHDQDLQPLAVAKALKFISLRDKVDMVIVGKQAIDGDNGQTGQMLAALLDWPQCTFISKVEIQTGNKEAIIDRETDHGSETLKVNLPAVFTADLRLNEPRFATLPNIMKAKKKPMEFLTSDAITDVDFNPQNKVVSVEGPPARKGGIIVENVDALIDKLKNEAKVI